jgi:UDP:flavonoid glycosyltransferase YjiC (YdhE family)
MDFLAAGPPPVVVTFGSMAAGCGHWLRDAVIGAVRESGVRAVVQAGWAQLDVAADERVFPLGEAAHSWLFPRAGAVVHHGGAGTSGAVFRAGVPSVITPIYADQPLWAARAHALGVGPRPIPFTRLNAENLAAAMRSAMTEPSYRTSADRLAKAVRRDSGAAPVIAQLEAIQG